MVQNLHKSARKFHKEILYRELKADIKKINHESKKRPGDKQSIMIKVIKSRIQDMIDSTKTLYINK